MISWGSKIGISPCFVQLERIDAEKSPFSSFKNHKRTFYSYECGNKSITSKRDTNTEKQSQHDRSIHNLNNSNILNKLNARTHPIKELRRGYLDSEELCDVYCSPFKDSLSPNDSNIQDGLKTKDRYGKRPFIKQRLDISNSTLKSVENGSILSEDNCFKSTAVKSCFKNPSLSSVSPTQRLDKVPTLILPAAAAFKENARQLSSETNLTSTIKGVFNRQSPVNGDTISLLKPCCVVLTLTDLDKVHTPILPAEKNATLSSESKVTSTLKGVDNEQSSTSNNIKSFIKPCSVVLNRFPSNTSIESSDMEQNKLKDVKDINSMLKIYRNDAHLRRGMHKAHKTSYESVETKRNIRCFRRIFPNARTKPFLNKSSDCFLNRMISNKLAYKKVRLARISAARKIKALSVESYTELESVKESEVKQSIDRFDDKVEIRKHTVTIVDLDPIKSIRKARLSAEVKIKAQSADNYIDLETVENSMVIQSSYNNSDKIQNKISTVTTVDLEPIKHLCKARKCAEQKIKTQSADIVIELETVDHSQYKENSYEDDDKVKIKGSVVPLLSLQPIKPVRKARKFAEEKIKTQSTDIVIELETVDQSHVWKGRSKVNFSAKRNNSKLRFKKRETGMYFNTKNSKLHCRNRILPRVIDSRKRLFLTKSSSDCFINKMISNKLAYKKVRLARISAVRKIKALSAESFTELESVKESKVKQSIDRFGDKVKIRKHTVTIVDLDPIKNIRRARLSAEVKIKAQSADNYIDRETVEKSQVQQSNYNSIDNIQNKISTVTTVDLEAIKHLHKAQKCAEQNIKTRSGDVVIELETIDQSQDKENSDKNDNNVKIKGSVVPVLHLKPIKHVRKARKCAEEKIKTQPIDIELETVDQSHAWKGRSKVNFSGKRNNSKLRFKKRETGMYFNTKSSKLHCKNKILPRVMDTRKRLFSNKSSDYFLNRMISKKFAFKKVRLARISAARKIKALSAESFTEWRSVQAAKVKQSSYRVDDKVKIKRSAGTIVDLEPIKNIRQARKSAEVKIKAQSADNYIDLETVERSMVKRSSHDNSDKIQNKISTFTTVDLEPIKHIRKARKCAEQKIKTQSGDIVIELETVDQFQYKENSYENNDEVKIKSSVVPLIDLQPLKHIQKARKCSEDKIKTQFTDIVIAHNDEKGKNRSCSAIASLDLNSIKNVPKVGKSAEQQFTTDIDLELETVDQSRDKEGSYNNDGEVKIKCCVVSLVDLKHIEHVRKSAEREIKTRSTDIVIELETVDQSQDKESRYEKDDKVEMKSCVVLLVDLKSMKNFGKVIKSLGEKTKIQSAKTSKLPTLQKTSVQKVFCNQCCMCLPSSKDLYYHTCIGKRRHGYVCIYCEKIFESKTTFLKHKKFHFNHVKS